MTLICFLFDISSILCTFAAKFKKRDNNGRNKQQHFTEARRS